MKYFVIVIIGAVFSLKTAAQEKIEPVLYGNMDHWVVRNIKESGIIGGNAKTL